MKTKVKRASVDGVVVRKVKKAKRTPVSSSSSPSPPVAAVTTLPFRPVEDSVVKKTVLVTVFDKTGLVGFVKGLVDLGWDVVSCGGSMAKLKEAGVPVKDVGEVLASTGQAPSMFNGGIKTLQPGVHGAILASTQEEHAELRSLGIEPIDMVVCNLAPAFDIGGSALLRCAAKNHSRVVTVSHPTHYPSLLNILNTQHSVPEYTRRYLAYKALRATAAYDAQLADHLNPQPVKPEERLSMLEGFIEENHEPFFE